MNWSQSWDCSRVVECAHSDEVMKMCTAESTRVCNMFCALDGGTYLSLIVLVLSVILLFWAIDNQGF